MATMRSLEEMSDRWDLQDLVTRYASCVDAQDFEGLDKVFHPEATLSFTAAGGPEGQWPQVRAWLAETLPIFFATQHLVSNLEVRIDGGTATGRCMCFNPMSMDLGQGGDPHVMFYGLWYLLRFQHTREGWRIVGLEQAKAYHHNLPS